MKNIISIFLSLVLVSIGQSIEINPIFIKVKATCCSCGADAGIGELFVSERLPSQKRLQFFEDMGLFENVQIAARPTIVTFLYTSCANVNKCPAVAAHVFKLQDLIIAEGLRDLVQIVVITYDPKTDSNEIWNEYVNRLGLKPKGAVIFLRPKSLDVFAKWNINVGFNRGRVVEHRIEAVLLDRHLREVRRYFSLLWDNRSVLSDLKGLLSEN